MRCAIFSDIHSNLEALEAVERSLADERVEGFFCAGDIVGYGADPHACIERVKRLGGMCVAGNHDLASCGAMDTASFNEEAAEAALWTRSRLTAEESSFLQSLSLTARGAGFVMAHGTLDAPETFDYMLDPATAARSFLRMEQPVCFVGHTHVSGVFTDDGSGSVTYSRPGTVRLHKDKRYIVNVGSVGQPRDGDPSACYCLFDSDDGEISVRRVGYDAGLARKKIIQRGLPAVLGDRLLLGR